MKYPRGDTKSVTPEKHPGVARGKIPSHVAAIKNQFEKAAKAGADGVANVGSVAGYYVCDGGCDKATISTAYAKRLAAAGEKIHFHPKPQPAKLADGTVANIIMGYAVLDIDLVTRAGRVVLARTHIDVLDGPEADNLLYLGKAEEQRLNLKSFAQQLEQLAKNQSPSISSAPDKGSKGKMVES